MNEKPLYHPKTRAQVEDRAMVIVNAIKRELSPDWDTNDGGECLSWLIDFGLAERTRGFDVVRDWIQHRIDSGYGKGDELKGLRKALDIIVAVKCADLHTGPTSPQIASTMGLSGHIVVVPDPP